MMESHMAMPRERHLEAVLHVFAFLHHNYNTMMEFYTTYRATNMSGFKECKLKYLYGELDQSISPNASEGKGKEVDVHGYVDSDNTGENKQGGLVPGLTSS